MLLCLLSFMWQYTIFPCPRKRFYWTWLMFLSRLFTQWFAFTFGVPGSLFQGFRPTAAHLSSGFSPEWFGISKRLWFGSERIQKRAWTLTLPVCLFRSWETFPVNWQKYDAHAVEYKTPVKCAWGSMSLYSTLRESNKPPEASTLQCSWLDFLNFSGSKKPKTKRCKTLFQKDLAHTFTALKSMFGVMHGCKVTIFSWYVG